MTAPRRVLLVAPRDRLSDLGALIRAWHAAGVQVDSQTFDGEMPDLRERVSSRDDLCAALLIGPARRAPATVLAAPFLVDRGNRRVPVGWLPATGAVPLRRFAAAAARVHRRKGCSLAVALLGQWHPLYLRIVDRMDALISQHRTVFRWSSDVITREGLIQALGSGLGLGVYLGHGRPVGWVGYHGLRARHFDKFDGEPMGAVISLCCHTASRRRTAVSYAEMLPLLGVAAASLGAVTETRHTDNTRWALRICECLCAGGVETIGELIARAAPGLAASAPYRLMGDPLAPLRAAGGGERRAAAITTYP
jgi:hypothetical protein